MRFYVVTMWAWEGLWSKKGERRGAAGQRALVRRRKAIGISQKPGVTCISRIVLFWDEREERTTVQALGKAGNSKSLQVPTLC